MKSTILEPWWAFAQMKRQKDSAPVEARKSLDPFSDLVERDTARPVTEVVVVRLPDYELSQVRVACQSVPSNFFPTVYKFHCSVRIRPWLCISRLFQLSEYIW